MLTINNEPTADAFSDLLTIESHLPGSIKEGGRLVYVVANASVVARFRPLLDASSGQAEYGLEIVLTPTASFIDRISGAKFRSAVAGSPGRVIAQLTEPGDILPASGTPFTQVLAASGAVGAVGVIDRVTAVVSVSNSAAEGTLYSKVIAANSLGPTGILRLTLNGDYFHGNLAADTFTLRVRWGGAVVWQSVSAFGGVVDAVGRQSWRLVLELANLGVTNSQLLGGMFRATSANTPAPAVGEGSLEAGGVFTAAIEQGVEPMPSADTTLDQTLAFTVQPSAASGNLFFRARQGLLELL